MKYDIYIYFNIYLFELLLYTVGKNIVFILLISYKDIIYNNINII